MAEAAGYDFSLMHACLAVGTVHARQGRPEKAIPSLERGARIAESNGLGLILPVIVVALGSAYVGSGRLSEAVTLLEQERDRTARRTLPWHALLLAQLGEAYLSVGRIDDAGEAARQACELARKRSERGFEAWAMRLLGEIHARQDPPDAERAEAAYVEAMARAEELGMRPLLAHCHLGLGKLSQRTGKREQAREHLITAIRMYREMEMPFWLRKAKADAEELA
jgi:tetratricopeptide (TPR) repeat protein